MVVVDGNLQSEYSYQKCYTEYKIDSGIHFHVSEFNLLEMNSIESTSDNGNYLCYNTASP